jgi:two-component system CheB/CheR fusion protein
MTENLDNAFQKEQILVTELKTAAKTEKENAHQLQATNRQLEHIRQELEEFVFIISHDLHEPVRKIRLFVNQLKQQLSDTSPDGEGGSLQRVLDASEKLESLFQDVLDYATVTKNTAPFEATDLHQAAQTAISDLTSLITDMNARVKLAAHLPVIDANSKEICWLLQQLIKNALSHQSPDRNLVVEISGEQVAGLSEKETRWRITVADNGVGFDPQYAERIFRIFEKLEPDKKPDQNGSGLTISRKIVEKHGGRIWAEGTPGQGARFFMEFPVSRGQHPAEEC